MHWFTRGVATTTMAITLVLPAGIAQAAPAPDTQVNRSSAYSSALASTDCPSGWLCLYQDANFRGRMLKFRDNHWQQLSSFGSNDKTSSWVNHLGRYVCLSWNWPPGGRRVSLPPGESAHMGSWNDKASGVKAGPGDCIQP
jgi:Peptidase inhibitor family I36